jgi:hypothetical protein
MSAPIRMPPRNAQPSNAPLEPASNEDFPDQAAADAAHATTGWDPYEVWRTRVFLPHPASYKKGRGNT